MLTATSFSTHVPDGEFNAMFQPRLERIGRDAQISHEVVKFGVAGGSSKTAIFCVPDNGATYFLEHNHASLSKYSLGYNMNTGVAPQTTDLGIKLPNYSCPEIVEGQNINLCAFD